MCGHVVRERSRGRRYFFFQAEDGIRDGRVTGVQTCALPIFKDPAAQAKKPSASAPFDYVEWGSTVYSGWLAVDQAAIAITETAPLFLTPGRRSEERRVGKECRSRWARDHRKESSQTEQVSVL